MMAGNLSGESRVDNNVQIVACNIINLPVHIQFGKGKEQVVVTIGLEESL
ncbi:hypothetical protein Hanom_Chr16g01459251 [Helianthus anomalus]